MYQIMYTSGMTLVVIGSGDNGLSRIDDSTGREVHRGIYPECVKWLVDRGDSEASVQNRAHPVGQK